MVGRISYTIEKDKGPTGIYLTIRHGHTVVDKGPVWPDKNHQFPHDLDPELDPDAVYLTWEDIYNIFDYKKIKILALE